MARDVARPHRFRRGSRTVLRDRPQSGDLFVDLQNSTFTPVPAVPVTVKFNANLIRVGLDYKFNH
jgi:hypothetical protein